MCYVSLATNVEEDDKEKNVVNTGVSSNLGLNKTRQTLYLRGGMEISLCTMRYKIIFHKIQPNHYPRGRGLEYFHGSSACRKRRLTR